MSQKYVLAPMAEADLEGIWIYTAHEWSREQADLYTNDIIDAFEDIAAGKNAGRPSLVREGYLKALIGRQAIYYQIRSEVIAIIRILHQSMDVERRLQFRRRAALRAATAASFPLVDVKNGPVLDVASHHATTDAALTTSSFVSLSFFLG